MAHDSGVHSAGGPRLPSGGRWQVVAGEPAPVEPAQGAELEGRRVHMSPKASRGVPAVKSGGRPYASKIGRRTAASAPGDSWP